jgi:hypothetical protein
VAALTEADATARAEAAVRAYCGWHVGPSKTETFTLDGPGSPILLLPTLRVTDVLAVTESGTLVAPEDYEWSTTGVVRRTSGSHPTATWGPGWTSRFRGVEVEAIHGYETLPLDVTAVIERLAARALEWSKGSALLSQVGQVSYATGEDGAPLSGTLSSLDRAVLDRYRLPPRP